MRFGPVPRSIRRARPGVETLGRRLLPSAASPPVVMLLATTADSRGVTVAYDVTTAAPDPALAFGVYRSADATLGPGDEAVGSPIEAPTLDDSGLPASSPGVHTLTLAVPGGLTINPEHPYVLVAADPGSTAPVDPRTVAGFRTASIAIVTHGGLQYDHWIKNGPPWTRQMANSLRKDGFDAVINDNWVKQSSTPGAAAKQGPKLAEMVLDAAAKLPAGEPVDLQFIGHSEGTVVNTLAIVDVEAKATPEIKAGYLDDTLLDPHAANPDARGTQYSTSGILGWVAKLAIDNYQARARDPLVFIPPQVDAAQVFYQQTAASRGNGLDPLIYNLWGQVPVKGPAAYFNLTADGIIHSGKHSVYAWYEHHVVSSLGDGQPEVVRSTLAGHLAAQAAGQATYAGTAEPGATVRLRAGAPNSGHLKLVGEAVAGADGSWTATTKPLAVGTHRIVADALAPGANPRRPGAVPTTPMGAFVVGGAARK